MKTSKQEIAARTQAIIETYRGLPGEFYMLKGLLCLDGAIGEYKSVRRIFDTSAIAERMDEINRADVAAAQRIAAETLARKPELR